jgi:hypothetical protein
MGLGAIFCQVFQDLVKAYFRFDFLFYRLCRGEMHKLREVINKIVLYNNLYKRVALGRGDYLYAESIGQKVESASQ